MPHTGRLHVTKSFVSVPESWDAFGFSSGCTGGENFFDEKKSAAVND
jgi:hypothetical protein